MTLLAIFIAKHLEVAHIAIYIIFDELTPLFYMPLFCLIISLLHLLQNGWALFFSDLFNNVTRGLSNVHIYYNLYLIAVFRTGDETRIICLTEGVVQVVDNLETLYVFNIFNGLSLKKMWWVESCNEYLDQT